MSVVCEKICTKLSSGQIEQVHTDECQFSFVHVSGRMKVQTSVNSSVCLQEFKQCLSEQVQRKIMNKIASSWAIICFLDAILLQN